MCGKDVPCIDGEGKAEAKRIKMYKKKIAHISKITQIPFSLIMLFIINGNESFFDQLSGKGCSDTFTEEMFIFFNEKIKEVKSKNTNFLVMLFIMWIVDLLKLAFNKHKKKKKRAAKLAAKQGKGKPGEPKGKKGTVHPQPQQPMGEQPPQQQQQQQQQQQHPQQQHPQQQGQP